MKKLRLHTQLAIFFSAFLLLFSAVASVAYVIRTSAHLALEQAFSRDLSAVTRLFALQEELRRLNLVDEEYLITKKQPWLVERGSIRSTIDSTLSEVEGLLPRELAPQDLIQFRTSLRQYFRSEDSLVEQRQSGSLSDTKVFEIVTGKESVEDTLRLLRRVGESSITLLQSKRSATDRASRQSLLLVLAVGVLGSLCLSWVVSRYVARPIKAIADAGDNWKLGEEFRVATPPTSVELSHLVFSLGAMADRLNQQYRELERSNHELEGFAAVASHDLRSPLRTIGGFAELLHRDYKGKLSPDADENLVYIVDGVKRLDRLVTGLLTYARLGSAGHDFSTTDCEGLVSEVLASLKLPIQESGAQITTYNLPSLDCDPLQFTQLFQNLISNAIKYRSTTPPRVHIAAEERDAEWLISVSDNGMGIDPENVVRVFEVFKRLHTDTEYSGVGLGLAICKKIVERHGGRIWLTSERGRGTTVLFTVPKKGYEAEVSIPATL